MFLLPVWAFNREADLEEIVLCNKRLTVRQSSLTMATVKKLKEQIKELQEELNQKQSLEMNKRKVVYLAPTREMSKFSGYVRKDGDIHIDDWIEEIQNAIEIRGLSREESIDFIYSNLTGSAKDEIRYRNYDERHNPTAIFRILRETFGEREGITVLQRQFFERKQETGESLRKFSYALMEFIKKVTKKDKNIVSNADQLLCEQFAQNVKDVSLRRELKKLLRQRPCINFLDFRDEAILFSEEEEQVSLSRDKTDSRSNKGELLSGASDKSVTEKSACATGTSTELNKCLEAIKTQQKQIDSLTKLLEKQTISRDNRGSPKINKRRCYICNSENHLRRDCPRFHHAGN